MTSYLIRRSVQMVPAPFLVSLFVFFLVRLVPGDPAAVILGQRATVANVAKLRHQLGLDRPLREQYGIFVREALHGNLGESSRKHEPVTNIVLQRLPPTLFLAVHAMVLPVIVTVPLAAWGRSSKGGGRTRWCGSSCLSHWRCQLIGSG